MSARRIEAVLFDLDGTLYDRDRLAGELFQQQYALFAAELRDISRQRFIAEVLAMDDHGHGPKEAGYRALAESWGLGTGLADRLLAHFRAAYDRHCHLTDDARYTLEELRRRRLKLAIITNGETAMQRRKIAALGIEPFFDAILVSEKEGVRKPDAEIFRRALARCGVAAHEAVFVGDHPVADVEGAQRAGLTAVWKFVPYWQPVVDTAVIRELSEVLSLLGPPSPNRAEP